MSMSQSCASNVVPLLLRLGLGVVFLWAGWGKFNGTLEVSGSEAALLANVGIIAAPLADAAPDETVDEEAEPDPEPDPEPESDAEAADEPASEAEPADEPEGDPSDSTVFNSLGAAPSIVRVQAAQEDEPRFTAEDYPDPVTTTRVYSVALMLMRAAEPSDGSTPLWPAGLAKPWMVKGMSYGVTALEFAGGLFLLVGFLTRLTALGLVATVGGAMLLTTIGPAVASGDSFLGFLPPLQLKSETWIQAWMPWLFQLLLALMAGSLVLTGAGALSIDRFAFGRRARRKAERVEYEED